MKKQKNKNSFKILQAVQKCDGGTNSKIHLIPHAKYIPAKYYWSPKLQEKGSKEKRRGGSSQLIH